MITDGTVTLTWAFSPEDFFEVDFFEFDALGHRVLVSAGKVEVEIGYGAYETSVEDELNKLVEARFRAGGVLEHRPYRLSKPDKTVVCPNGQKMLCVRTEPATSISMACNPDVVILDKDGRIIVDSKQERIDKRFKFGELLAKHGSDAVLEKMINSYKAAVRDRCDELVHLYEVRDAAFKRFGDAAKAQRALGVTSAAWSEFGDICNGRPLRQGRHRGGQQAPAREATDEELSKARNFARSLIENYVMYLDKYNKNSE